MTLEPGKEGVTKGTRDATRMARVFSRAIIRSSNFNFSLFLVVFPVSFIRKSNSAA